MICIFLEKFLVKFHFLRREYLFINLVIREIEWEMGWHSIWRLLTLWHSTFVGDQAIAVKRTICNWIAASGSTTVGFNSNKISFLIFDPQSWSSILILDPDPRSWSSIWATWSSFFRTSKLLFACMKGKVPLIIL